MSPVQHNEGDAMSECAVICGLTNGERQETCGACPDYMTTDQQQEARWEKVLMAGKWCVVIGSRREDLVMICETEAIADQIIRDHGQADIVEALRAENAELQRQLGAALGGQNACIEACSIASTERLAAELRAEALATALESALNHVALGDKDTILHAALDAHRAEAPKKN